MDRNKRLRSPSENKSGNNINDAKRVKGASSLSEEENQNNNNTNIDSRKISKSRSVGENSISNGNGNHSDQGPSAKRQKMSKDINTKKGSSSPSAKRNNPDNLGSYDGFSKKEVLKLILQTLKEIPEVPESAISQIESQTGVILVEEPARILKEAILDTERRLVISSSSNDSSSNNSNSKKPPAIEVLEDQLFSHLKDPSSGTRSNNYQNWNHQLSPLLRLQLRFLLFEQEYLERHQKGDITGAVSLLQNELRSLCKQLDDYLESIRGFNSMKKGGTKSITNWSSSTSVSPLKKVDVNMQPDTSKPISNKDDSADFSDFRLWSGNEGRRLAKEYEEMLPKIDNGLKALHKISKGVCNSGSMTLDDPTDGIASSSSSSNQGNVSSSRDVHSHTNYTPLMNVTNLGKFQKRLHAMSGLLACPSGGNPQEAGSSSSSSNNPALKKKREGLWSVIASLLPSSLIPPEKRLTELLYQAVQYQEAQCPFHYRNACFNTGNNGNQNALMDHSDSLLEDHLCPNLILPNSNEGKSEVVMDAHVDEVWAVSVSGDGKYYYSLLFIVL